MEVDFESLMIEGQQFVKLRGQFRSSNNPEAGTPAFLISLDWMQKYKKHIHYDVLRRNLVPQQEANQEPTHPGKIKNSDFLEVDVNQYLSGTGSDKESEHELMDRYIKEEASEGRNFDVCSAEIWEFLSTKYGFDYEVKRFYQKSSQWQYSTSVELFMKKVPVVFLYIDDLSSKEDELNTLTKRFVQIRKSGTYSDLKKRIADCATQLRGVVYQSDQVRLWQCTSDEDVVESFKKVSASMKLNTVMSAQSNDQIEENTGVTCPGKSLEPFVGSNMTLKDKTFVNEYILVEIASSFAYRFEKLERVVIGSCEWCNQKNVLQYICKCKRVRYCDEACMEKDKRFHFPQCSSQADQELNSVNIEKSSNSKNGKVGLQNLGNTCYMNSSLQCLSNTYELTRFFLEQRFKFINQFQAKNVLGTEGRLVMAYAKTLNEMWNMDSNVVRPDMFKRILGEYAQQFQGYGQHDSHECINTILDLLGEDLYRKGKKPYIDLPEKEGLEEEQAAKEAWNRHLYRNESIITDLFHGQFKSTVSCSKCDRVSVTFDPMMTLALPIPMQKKTLSFFYVPYNIGSGYVNYSGSIKLRLTDSVMTFREQIYEKFKTNIAQYTITKVNNNEFTRFFSLTNSCEELTNEDLGRVILCYEIDPLLNPGFKNIKGAIDKKDSNNGVDESYIRLNCGVATLTKQMYSQKFTKETQLPRIIWVNRKFSFKQLHHYVFEYFTQIMIEWIDWKDPKTTKVPKPDSKVDLRTNILPDFPYKLPNSSSQITKDEFFALTAEQRFEMCFPGLSATSTDPSQDDDTFELNQMPYKLLFKRISGYYEPCNYCNSTKCTNCTLPYSDQFTIDSQLEKLKLTNNDTYFSELRSSRGKELEIQVVWHQDIPRALFNFLATAVPLPPIENDTSDSASQPDGVRLVDCLKEFKQKETLDKENMWYCSKCKEHVQATKTLEVFKVPRILIITLKRFKQSRQKFSLGGGQKLDTFVDFPLEGLDMAPFVLSNLQKSQSSLTYDLFAVSNHYGSVGFGHYTAFGKNFLNGQWYSFDDSNCTPVVSGIGRKEIQSNAAYSLFYRLRESSKETSINFEALQQQPDAGFIQEVQQHELAKQKKK